MRFTRPVVEQVTWSALTRGERVSVIGGSSIAVIGLGFQAIRIVQGFRELNRLKEDDVKLRQTMASMKAANKMMWEADWARQKAEEAAARQRSEGSEPTVKADTPEKTQE